MGVLGLQITLFVRCYRDVDPDNFRTVFVVIPSSPVNHSDGGLGQGGRGLYYRLSGINFGRHTGWMLGLKVNLQSSVVLKR